MVERGYIGAVPDRPGVRRSRIMLLRLLFPSWAFFDAVTDVPRLEIRLMPSSALPGEWQPALQAPPRGLRHLLLNTEGTEGLAVQAVVDRFAVECETGLVDAVTHALVERIAARAVHALIGASSASPDRAFRWQWRIVAVHAVPSASTHDAARPSAHDGGRVLHLSAPYEGGDTTPPDPASR